MFVFIHYVKLSHPIVIAAMIAGAVSTIVSIAMVMGRPSGNEKALPFVLAAITITLGLAGSMLNATGVNNAALIETGAGMRSSASQYYDIECGYVESFFRAFPFTVGVVCALPALVLGSIIMMRKK